MENDISYQLEDDIFKKKVVNVNSDLMRKEEMDLNM